MLPAIFAGAFKAAITKGASLVFSMLAKAFVSYAPVLIVQLAFDVLDDAVDTGIDKLKSKFKDNPNPRYLKRIEKLEGYWEGFQEYLPEGEK